MDSSQAKKASTSAAKQPPDPVSLLDTKQPEIGPSTLYQAITDPGKASPSTILALQRTHGNQFVQRLLTGPRLANASPHVRPGEAIQRQIYPDGNLTKAYQPAAAVRYVKEALEGLGGHWSADHKTLVEKLCGLGQPFEVSQVAQQLYGGATTVEEFKAITKESKEEKDAWDPFGLGSFQPSSPRRNSTSPSSNLHPSPFSAPITPPRSSSLRPQPSSSSPILEPSNPFAPIVSSSSTPVGGPSRGWTMPEEQIGHRPQALQDLERFIENPNYLFEEAERELMAEIDEKTPLISPSIRKAEKKDEKFLKKQEKNEKKRDEKREKEGMKREEKREKEEKKKAKRITKDPEKEPLLDEEKVPVKGKLLIKASEKMTGAVDTLTAPVSDLYGEHYNKKYHKLEKQQREDWMNYGDIFLKLFHKWVRQMNINPELLWDFIDTRYPNLATFCMFGWGITESDLGIKGEEKEETEGGSGKG
ncbi:MAG: hypothetical protein H0T73_19205, partial [Ardenticatenales bacterium]|nr:hypothetical protein [Ardenticatenales bacterium]